MNISKKDIGKRLISVLLVYIMITCSFAATTVSAAEVGGVGYTIEGTFPDPNMGSAVANLLGKSVYSKITQADIDKSKVWEINNTNIKDITGIHYFKNLETLVINYSKLQSLPESIGQLKNLTNINLYSNELTHLPDAIGDLSSLKYLTMYQTQVTKLPESIGNLSNLEVLCFQESKLTSIPETIGNLSNLQSLYLGGNQLTSIPESIYYLPKLTMLQLQYNQLSSLSETIENMTNLEQLALFNNQLIALPESIVNLSKVKDINASYNQITYVSDTVYNFFSKFHYTHLYYNLLNFGQQDSLIANSNEVKNETITSQADYERVLASASTLVKLKSDAKLSPAHNFIFDNCVDTNGNKVYISNYINGGKVIKEGTINVAIRTIGEGKIIDNSTNAITPTRPLALNFVFSTATEDTSVLESTLSSAKAITNNNYTTASWETLQNAIKSATDLLATQGKTQAQIDEECTKLKDAVDALVLIATVDTSALDTLLANAKTINGEDYTLQSWETLQNAIKSATDLLATQGKTQAQINEECTKLKDAVDKLIKNTETASNSITKFTLDSYESVIDQENKTITLTVPENILSNGRIEANVTELEADSETIIFNVSNTEYPNYKLGDLVGFSAGDKVYVSKDNTYTFVINTVEVEVQSSLITKFTLDSYESVIDQENKTITLTVPEEILSNGRIEATLTELEADSEKIIFKVSNTEYPNYKLGDFVGFSAGDKVYVSKDNAYTFVIKTTSTSGNQIHKLSIGKYPAVIDHDAQTITFAVPAEILATNKLTSKITELEADSNAIIFIVNGKEVPREKGVSTAVRMGDSIYVSSDNIYTVVLTAI